MTQKYFKYKALSISPQGELDDRTRQQVIEPIVESYFYLPTRDKLNDPNEGIFKNQIQAGISGFLKGVLEFGEVSELANAFRGLARQITQSTDNSGVFSLSGNVTDELLWAHYVASHCGIAIEYDIDQLTRFCAKRHLHRFKVIYSDSPPILDFHYLEQSLEGPVIAMLGHKSPRWSYEEEFRILAENMNGKIPHDY